MQYFDYVLSNNIIDMFLHLEDNELATPLPDAPVYASDHITTHGVQPNTNFFVNLISDDECDPLILQHAKQSKYWNKWLTTMHEELEALKSKDVYEEVEELPHG
jgi:hypothetical protein